MAGDDHQWAGERTGIVGEVFDHGPRPSFRRRTQDKGGDIVPLLQQLGDRLDGIALPDRDRGPKAVERIAGRLA